MNSRGRSPPDGSPIPLVLADGRRVQLLPTAVPEPGILMIAGLIGAGGLKVGRFRRLVS